jgi:hypothetical protein
VEEVVAAVVVAAVEAAVEMVAFAAENVASTDLVTGVPTAATQQMARQQMAPTESDSAAAAAPTARAVELGPESESEAEAEGEAEAEPEPEANGEAELEAEGEAEPEPESEPKLSELKLGKLRRLTVSAGTIATNRSGLHGHGMQAMQRHSLRVSRWSHCGLSVLVPVGSAQDSTRRQWIGRWIRINRSKP